MVCRSSVGFKVQNCADFETREISAKITKLMRDVAVEKLEVYRKWFNDHVMQSEKQNTIVVLPIENITPRYRDEAT